MILRQAGLFGGWSLFTKGGKVKYCYNWIGLKRTTADSGTVPGPGIPRRFTMPFMRGVRGCTRVH